MHCNPEFIGILSTGPLWEITSVCFYPGLILLAPNSWWASGDVGWCWNTVTDPGYGEAFSYAPMRPQYGCFTQAPPPRSNHLDSLQVLWTRVRDECCACEQTDVVKLLMWFFGNPLQRMCESGLSYWLNFLKTIYYFKQCSHVTTFCISQLIWYLNVFESWSKRILS